LKELLRRCDVSEFEIDTLLTQFHAEEINELNFNNEFYDFQTDHGQNMTVQNTFTNGSIPAELSGLNLSPIRKSRSLSKTREPNPFQAITKVR